MIKNYVVVNDCVILFINYREEIRQCLIDLEDLEKILNFPYAWYVSQGKDKKSFYVGSSVYIGKRENGKYKYKRIKMHKFLLEYTGNKKVDHHNHDSLDNRKSNLYIVENEKNTKNRKGKNSNNTTGYRNVSKIDNKYVVQLQVNGKNTIFGRFDDLQEAIKVADKKRKEIYGEFAGLGT